MGGQRALASLCDWAPCLACPRAHAAWLPGPACDPQPCEHRVCWDSTCTACAHCVRTSCAARQRQRAQGTCTLSRRIGEQQHKDVMCADAECCLHTPGALTRDPWCVSPPAPCMRALLPIVGAPPVVMWAPSTITLRSPDRTARAVCSVLHLAFRASPRASCPTGSRGGALAARRRSSGPVLRPAVLHAEPVGEWAVCRWHTCCCCPCPTPAWLGCVR